MASHNFQTGLLSKKHFNKKDIWHLLHSMTPAQSSFFRECISQHLGVKPSHYWGKQKIWFGLPNRDRETLIYLLEAFNHAPHIISSKISKHNKAASWITTAAHRIASDKKQGGNFITSAAKFAVEHGGEIIHGIDTALNVASQAGQVMNKFGLIDDDSGLTQASNLYQSLRGAWSGKGSGLHEMAGSRRVNRRRLGHLL